MTSTQTITQEDISKAVMPFDFRKLETVQWIEGTYYYQQTSKAVEAKFDQYKSYTLVKWFFATVEILLISALLLLQQIPFPESVFTYTRKVDHFTAESLEWTTNKLDWWWDIFTVRMMRLRDSLENVVDGVLSFALFCFILTSRIFTFFLQVLKLFFLPLTVIRRLVWPEPITSPPTTVTEGNEPVPVSPKDDNLETGDLNVSSEYESDASLLMEARNQTICAKNGHPYNRVDMKVTAEGKLRAIMYKRVKAQLQVMRKHSIRFSKDMASYVKEVWEPRMKPAVDVITEFIYKIAQKYGLVSVLESIKSQISKYPILSRYMAMLASVLLIPIELYKNVSSRRKSRRSRSVRSESSRRRKATAISPNPLLSLSQSTELIKEECGCGHSPSEGDFLARDSALASSIDDTATSDSNEGLNNLKPLLGATIVEETNHDEVDKAVTPLHSSNEGSINVLHKTRKSVNHSGNHKSPKRKERPKSMEGSQSEQEFYSSSPKLPRAKVFNSTKQKEERREAGFTSPRHGRRNQHRLKTDSGKFLTPEYVPSSPEVLPEDVTSRLLSTDNGDSKKRRISFTL